MQLSDRLALIAILVAALSFILSATVAYLTLMAHFKGTIWPVTTIVFTKGSTEEKDNIPMIGIFCFMENQGAKPGRLNNLRLLVNNAGVESSHTFYAHLMREGYSAVGKYSDSDWLSFGGIGLFEKRKALEYFILFKPQELDYVPASGEYEFILEALWKDGRRWVKIKPKITRTLTEKHASDWRSPTAPTFQIRERK